MMLPFVASEMKCRSGPLSSLIRPCASFFLYLRIFLKNLGLWDSNGLHCSRPLLNKPWRQSQRLCVLELFVAPEP